MRILYFTRDTIDMAVQVWRNLDSGDPNFERQIIEDPLMQFEFEKQQHDLNKLMESEYLEYNIINKLRILYRNSKSNIGL